MNVKIKTLKIYILHRSNDLPNFVKFCCGRRLPDFALVAHYGTSVAAYQGGLEVD